MIGPDKIRLAAKCETQDEHRFLYDWCNWLVEEVHAGAFAMAGAERHGQWRPPFVEMHGTSTTIHIEPTSTARYFPSSWTFELDRDAVFKRLIYDAYNVPHTFIRELIQNAADASRCAMFAELKRRGVLPPRYPTEVAAAIRQEYPISVSSHWVERRNDLSGEIEKRQVISIEDRGIGMDRSVIERYFLQVGRSFYDSDEFRRDFGFFPTSHFGVGFLSAFAESDEIEVDTFKPSSNDGPIRLKLTGHRSYLLTEVGTRRTTGTTIRLLMSKAISDADLQSAIAHWCKRLEFDVILVTPMMATTITREPPLQYAISEPDIRSPSAEFRVRVIPLEVEGVNAEIYFPIHVKNGIESWFVSFDQSWHQERYHPTAKIPLAPSNVFCLHGIDLSSDWRQSSEFIRRATIRADFRDPTLRLPLSRDVYLTWRNIPAPLLERIESIVREHIESRHKSL